MGGSLGCYSFPPVLAGLYVWISGHLGFVRQAPPCQVPLTPGQILETGGLIKDGFRSQKVDNKFSVGTGSRSKRLLSFKSGLGCWTSKARPSGTPGTS